MCVALAGSSAHPLGLVRLCPFWPAGQTEGQPLTRFPVSLLCCFLLAASTPQPLPGAADGAQRGELSSSKGPGTAKLGFKQLIQVAEASWVQQKGGESRDQQSSDPLLALQWAEPGMGLLPLDSPVLQPLPSRALGMSSSSLELWMVVQQFPWEAVKSFFFFLLQGQCESNTKQALQ